MANNAISGWGVLYNTPTVIAGLFIEKIAPGAFARSLRDEGDVLLLFGHDYNRVLARTTSGTLQLRDLGAMGLWFAADIDPGNPDAATALSAIGRRDVHGMSFGFLVAKEVWEEPESYDALPIRTILDADLFEISAVSRPAYPQTRAWSNRTTIRPTRRTTFQRCAPGRSVAQARHHHMMMLRLVPWLPTVSALAFIAALAHGLV